MAVDYCSYSLEEFFPSYYNKMRVGIKAWSDTKFLSSEKGTDTKAY
jgi:hypothetical protein